jgi:hypothetical protein
MNQELRNFVLAVLDDDNGISETAWYALHDLLQGSGELEFAGELAQAVDACEGRYYIDHPAFEPETEPEPEPEQESPEVRDTLRTWADEKEQLQHLLNLAQCSEV